MTGLTVTKGRATHIMMLYIINNASDEELEIAVETMKRLEICDTYNGAWDNASKFEVSRIDLKG